jgi:hypothetical protein
MNKKWNSSATTPNEHLVQHLSLRGIPCRLPVSIGKS